MRTAIFVEQCLSFGFEIKSTMWPTETNQAKAFARQRHPIFYIMYIKCKEKKNLNGVYVVKIVICLLLLPFVPKISLAEPYKTEYTNAHNILHVVRLLLFFCSLYVQFVYGFYIVVVASAFYVHHSFVLYRFSIRWMWIRWMCECVSRRAGK